MITEKKNKKSFSPPSEGLGEAVRKDFPILSRTVNGKPLIYFDNGATTQKPKQVIDAIVKYYTEQNANIHRGVHRMSQDATELYENARATIQKHINAKSPNEIIFTRGTTESINLVGNSLSKFYHSVGDELLLWPYDEIIVTEMEHHSNILPWQLVCEERQAVLKVVPINDNGELNLDEFKKLLSPKTRVVALTHVSNTLGTINPVKEIIKIVRAYSHPEQIKKPVVLIDGAQAVPHMKVDVQDLDADFYCFSGHKVYAPTGIGVLYAKESLMNKMSPYQVGGGTIKTVAFDKTEYAEGPLRFEAGTPNIEGAIGLASALDYLDEVGLDKIAKYEYELLRYAEEKISLIDGVKIIGTAKEKASVLSFVVDGIHPLDIGTLLDAQGIAVRTGHHCTQPLMYCYKINGTIRASFSFYNTKEEIDFFIKALVKSIERIKK
jgi:cysteine desulfurase/selenocysteine lyase